ncbi:hypothetical protein AOQ84DRAFT_368516 [Glonium stellatum]|uniref:Cytochrome P450 n=1 Tax=Glonium stellatum TaxID=574774 RepID=A0A8E2JN77_9PEZI|nr:hypothetical protein AOQ84DRAFT_368516 [Glonium stellatum]
MPYWLVKILSPVVGELLDSQKNTRNQVEEVKSKIAAGIKPERKTIFHQLLDPDTYEGHMVPSLDELAEESFVVCTATSDTTSNAMTIAMYNVVTNPVIYENLKKELRNKFLNKEAMLSFKTLEKLPYLTVVIKA